MIPYLDLTREIKEHENEIIKALKEVLDSGIFLFGQKTQELERVISSACNCNYGISVGCGTDAIQIITMALEIKPDEEILTTPLSFYSTAKAVSLANVKVRFADVDTETGILDPQSVAAHLTSKTRAVLVVHLYGKPAPMDKFVKLTENEKIFLLEDAAQALGAYWNNKPVGSFGTAAALSFYPTKTLGAFGDAGMIITNSENIAEKARYYRFLGNTGEKDYFNEVGILSRMDEIQAAIILAKWKYYRSSLEARTRLANRYDTYLTNLIRKPRRDPREKEVHYVYVVQTEFRDKLKEYLNKQGIPTVIHYTPPLHELPLYKKQGYCRRDYPNAEKYAAEVLSLPIYPGLTEDEQDKIIEKVNQFFEEHMGVWL